MQLSSCARLQRALNLVLRFYRYRKTFIRRTRIYQPCEVQVPGDIPNIAAQAKQTILLNELQRFYQ
ncbi:MAG TPA: hypothetical protein VGD22_08860 [Sphingobacteriaceae bacterium]